MNKAVNAMMNVWNLAQMFIAVAIWKIKGLMQERRNSIANALE